MEAAETETKETLKQMADLALGFDRKYVEKVKS
jgi:hypothetical protein